MSLSQDQPRGKTSRHLQEMVILLFIGGVKFAIAADAVDEVRELGGLKDFCAANAHPKLEKVRHVLERQGQRYFVLDGCSHFGTGSRRPTRLVVLRHAHAAVMVDSVDRMQAIQLVRPLPDAFSGKERDWYRGLAVLKGKVVPLLKPEAFLSKSEVALLNAACAGSDKEILVTA